MDKIIYEDTIGCAQRNNGMLLDECTILPAPLQKALISRMGQECRLTPIQEDALDAGICNRSSHYLVSAPTNSGKTLVGLFRVFTEIIKKRGRCVYIAPLKALAEEKRTEFETLADLIEKNGGPKIRTVITTGDYQLTNDFLDSPPPENGELVICTPERLEIMLRSSDNLFWARATSTFVLDEFHLLGDSHRGPAFEILVTRILSSCPWSRIVALSATMGGLEAVAKWIGSAGIHVELLESNWRYPILKRQVVSTSDKEAYTRKMAPNVLEAPDRSLLVFVSKKPEAEKLAKILRKDLPAHKTSISYLHAGLTLKERAARLHDLLEKKIRLVVATTALKMGIDAPVTDVLVRDPFLWGGQGSRLLRYSDLLQMTGRAGRRDSPGTAIILTDENQGERISQLFLTGIVDPLEPQLLRPGKDVEALLSILLTEIVMQKKTTPSHLGDYLNHTFAGTVTGPTDCRKQVNELIRLKLAYRDDEGKDTIQATKLGKTVSLTGLSPESGAMLAGFLRALIKLDEKYETRKGRRFGYLVRLTDLDLLFLCCACFECRNSWLRTPGKKTIADVQEFVETLPPDEKPIVNLWRSESSGDYPTRRLLTSLRVSVEKGKPEQCEKSFYRVLQTAILLYQHAKGVPLARLAAKFKVPLGELENNLKFSVLWILSCLSQICNGKRCYKFDFLMMRAIKLIECVAVGSELGELMTIKGVGRRSVEKILEFGIETLDDLADCKLSDMTGFGLKAKQAQLIHTWIRRRLR